MEDVKIEDDLNLKFINVGGLICNGDLTLLGGKQINIEHTNSSSIDFNGTIKVTDGDNSGKVKFYVKTNEDGTYPPIIFNTPGNEAQQDLEDFKNIFTLVDQDGNNLIGKELYVVSSTESVTRYSIRDKIKSVEVSLKTTKESDTKTTFYIDINAIDHEDEELSLEDLGTISYKFLLKNQDNTEIFNIPQTSPTYTYNSSLNGSYKLSISATILEKTYTNDSFTSFSMIYKVGDIIKKDGTCIRYSENYTFTDEEIQNAIAVIFREANGSEQALGIGLNKITGVWATSYHDSISAIKYTRDRDTNVITGGNDGSENWEAIKTADPSGTANPNTNYPLFYAALNYGTTYGIAGSYKNGWYIPAIKEMYDFAMCYKDNALFNTIIKKLDLDVEDKPGVFGNNLFATSNEGSSPQYELYMVGGGYGTMGNNKENSATAIPMHKF